MSGSWPSGTRCCQAWREAQDRLVPDDAMVQRILAMAVPAPAPEPAPEPAPSTDADLGAGLDLLGPGRHPGRSAQASAGRRHAVRPAQRAVRDQAGHRQPLRPPRVRGRPAPGWAPRWCRRRNWSSSSRARRPDRGPRAPPTRPCWVRSARPRGRRAARSSPCTCAARPWRCCWRTAAPGTALAHPSHLRALALGAEARLSCLAGAREEERAARREAHPSVLTQRIPDPIAETAPPALDPMVRSQRRAQRPGAGGRHRTLLPGQGHPGPDPGQPLRRHERRIGPQPGLLRGALRGGAGEPAPDFLQDRCPAAMRWEPGAAGTGSLGGPLRPDRHGKNISPPP